MMMRRGPSVFEMRMEWQEEKKRNRLGREKRVADLAKRVAERDTSSATESASTDDAEDL